MYRGQMNLWQVELIQDPVVSAAKASFSFMTEL